MNILVNLHTKCRKLLIKLYISIALNVILLAVVGGCIYNSYIHLDDVTMDKDQFYKNIISEDAIAIEYAAVRIKSNAIKYKDSSILEDYYMFLNYYRDLQQVCKKLDVIYNTSEWRYYKNYYGM
jgi:hypothetical protein